MGFRTARLAADKSVVEVAEAMSVSRMAVYNWENGGSYPEADKLLKLAKIYGCSVEDLLTDNPTREAVQ